MIRSILSTLPNLHKSNNNRNGHLIHDPVLPNTRTDATALLSRCDLWVIRETGRGRKVWLLDLSYYYTDKASLLLYTGETNGAAKWSYHVRGVGMEIFRYFNWEKGNTDRRSHWFCCKRTSIVVFGRSSTGIVGSNPTRDMDVCVSLHRQQPRDGSILVQGNLYTIHTLRSQF
jgi:hypothetical protein